MAVSSADLDLMAWTLLGEAAGEGPKGMQAVANVIVNRVNSGQYPSNIGNVVLQPKQFSAWNKGEGGNDPMGRYSKNSAAFRQARAIAEKVVNGQLPDITGGALNYWAPRGMKGGKDPYWAADVPSNQRLKIGNHVFLPTHPVPPAPLTAEVVPPTPAIMSRELAYARGLADPGAALAAINAATAGPQSYAGLDAYAPEAGKLTTVSRPTYSVGPGGVPFTPQVAGDLRRQIGTQPYTTAEDYVFADMAQKAATTPAPQAPVNWDEFYAGMPGISQPAPTTAGALTSYPGAGNYDPAAALMTLAATKPRTTLADIMGSRPPVAPSVSRDVTTVVQRPDGSSYVVPRAGSNEQPIERPANVGAAAFSQFPIYGDTIPTAKPRGPNALPDMSSPLYQAQPWATRPSMDDYYTPFILPQTDAAGGFNVSSFKPGFLEDPVRTGAPDFRALDAAMSPRQVTPASAPSPTIQPGMTNRGLPAQDVLMANMAGRGLTDAASTLRPVTNMIAAIPADTGIAYGMTAPGALPGATPAAPVTPFSGQTFPAFQTPPEQPAVNRKGYYLGNPFGDYTVGRGETLNKIAKKFDTSVQDIVAANNIPNPGKISTGALLAIPQRATTNVAARTGTAATPTGGTVPTDARTAIARTGGGGSATTTPTTYTPPKQTVTSATKVSIPVYSTASITPTKTMATTPTGSTITQAQMNAIRGLATGGPVPGYATGSAVLDWSGGADYQKNLINALNTVNAAKTVATITPIGAIVNAVAPSQVQTATWNAAQALAAPKSGTSSYTPQTNMEKLAAAGWSPSMMEGSPATVSSGGGGTRRDRNTAQGGTTTTSTGGIDGVIGTYNPPTQAQIDALYAPYFRAAQFPPAGYEPGVSGEFNYFPQVAAPTAPTTAPAPQSSWLAKAADWYKSYSGNLGSRSSYDAAKQVKAPDGTSLYTLYKQFRDSLSRGTSPTLGTWQSWLATKGYATGGQISEPRLVLGKGGPTADKIPARIDGVQEARLSNGEFVMTAAAVRGLGNGDYKRGAEALMRLNDQFAPRHDKGTLKVEKVR